MKFQYYVNVDDLIDRNDKKLIVDFQGKQFKSVKVISSSIQSSVSIPNPILKLNTFVGNGLTSDRKSLALCIYDNITNISLTDQRFSISKPGVLYLLPKSLTNIIITVELLTGIEFDPFTFDSMAMILELEDYEEDNCM